MKISNNALLKKFCIAVTAVTLTGVIAAAFSACKKEEETKSNPEYLNNVSSYSFWNNTAETSIPEYRTYHHVHDFLDECEIKDGKAIAKNGKIRKVLFIGFDGMRADALPYVLDNAGNSKTNVSGIAQLKRDGGIYLAYCGGGTLINIKNDGTFTTQSLIRHRGQNTIIVCKEK